MSEKLSREQVREALAIHDSWERTIARDYPEAHKIPPAPTYALLAAAAQAWLDQGDALVIRKVNGEWPILCGEPSPETQSLCVLPPTREAHNAGHESEYVNNGRAVWSTLGESWWERLNVLAGGEL